MVTDCLSCALNRVRGRVHIVQHLNAVLLRHTCVDHHLFELIEGLAFHGLSCVESRNQLCFHPLQLSSLLLILKDQLPLLHGFESVFVLDFT